jgi:hypothetical protein
MLQALLCRCRLCDNGIVHRALMLLLAGLASVSNGSGGGVGACCLTPQWLRQNVVAATRVVRWCCLVGTVVDAWCRRLHANAMQRFIQDSTTVGYCGGLGDDGGVALPETAILAAQQQQQCTVPCTGVISVDGSCLYHYCVGANRGSAPDGGGAP